MSKFEPSTQFGWRSRILKLYVRVNVNFFLNTFFFNNYNMFMVCIFSASVIKKRSLLFYLYEDNCSGEDGSLTVL